MLDPQSYLHFDATLIIVLWEKVQSTLDLGKKCHYIGFIFGVRILKFGPELEIFIWTISIIFIYGDEIEVEICKKNFVMFPRFYF